MKSYFNFTKVASQPDLQPEERQILAKKPEWKAAVIKTINDKYAMQKEAYDIALEQMNEAPNRNESRYDSTRMDAAKRVKTAKEQLDKLDKSRKEAEATDVSYKGSDSDAIPTGSYIKTIDGEEYFIIAGGNGFNIGHIIAISPEALEKKNITVFDCIYII